MIIHDIGQDFATKTHRGDICDIYLMTIMSMYLTTEKILFYDNNLILVIMFTDIYILLYMYHDFTFDVIVIITELS